MTTALIVDDVLVNLHLMQAILAGAGMSVVSANDGAAALELARASRPDVIVSDILMPRMDGFALCREVRRDPVLRSVPFVFYTATYTDPRDEKLALSMGADRFLVKPLEPATLLAEVQEVMRRAAEPGRPEFAPPPERESVVLHQYNQALVRKLEQKLKQLEVAIEQRDENERMLQHLNAVLRAIRSVNQLIVRERRAGPLVEQVCNVLASIDGFDAIWVVVEGAGPDGLLAAQRGFADADFGRLLARIREGEWPACCRIDEARRTGQAHATRGAECGSCPLARDGARVSEVAIPLVYSGRAFGCLGVVLTVQFADIEGENSLLEEVAGDIAFALHAIASEEVHRESERTLAAIFENVRDGILLVDGDTRRPVRANPSMCQMLGCPEPSISALALDDLQPEGTSGAARFPFELQAGGDSSLGEAIPVRRRDGTVFLADVNATIVSPQGRDCLLCVFRDVTERRQAERERQELQAQLSQAQKMESIGRLAGGVAHDFNNMLSVILGHTEFALEDLPPDHPLAEDLAEVHRAARHSMELTRQLLAFARKQTFEPQVLDLNEVVAGMHGMLRRLIGEDIDLVWRPGENVWPVRTDPSQIDQILANLCVNARDAIAGTGRIVIETENRVLGEECRSLRVGAKPGSYVTLMVSDSGSGMDRETQRRLFEPFFTTKEVGRGTGLGLATVYGIVKQNGGAIDVYSEPGHGTAFRIYLPRSASKPVPEGEEEQSGPVPGGSETILLVEDEPSIMRVAASMLERQGYAVLRAGSPGEAVELAESGGAEFDLLLTDVVMPGMNGRALAERLRARRPDLPVVFMSGYTPGALALQDALGEDAFFVGKPFSRRELGTMVRQALDSRGGD